MSWLNRLLGRKRHISREEFTVVLAHAIFDQAATLASKVDESASLIDEADLRPPRAAVYLECLMFLWGLTDRLVVEEFPGQSRQVCSAIAAWIDQEMAWARQVGGQSCVPETIKPLLPEREHLHQLRQKRSVEYASLNSLGDVQLFCGIAARRVLSGEADPFPSDMVIVHQLVAATLAIYISSLKQTLIELGKKFEIVDS